MTGLMLHCTVCGKLGHLAVTHTRNVQLTFLLHKLVFDSSAHSSRCVKCHSFTLDPQKKLTITQGENGLIYHWKVILN